MLNDTGQRDESEKAAIGVAAHLLFQPAAQRRGGRDEVSADEKRDSEDQKGHGAGHYTAIVERMTEVQRDLPERQARSAAQP
jgi:hypothetical protein